MKETAYAFPIEGLSRGMELRDYFAAKALQGLLASDLCAPLDNFVKKAYEIADTMMKAREQ